MKPSLEGSYRKLERGKEHLREMEAEVGDFLKADTHEVFGDINPESGSDWLYLRPLKQPDPEWEMTLSEVALHLRSALDYLVFQLAMLDGGNPEEELTQFPIFRKSKDYLRPRGNRPTKRDIMLQGVSEPHRAMIDLVQPYQLGNQAHLSPLVTLNALSNRDKHKTFHPGFVLLDASCVDIPDNPAGIEMIRNRNPERSGLIHDRTNLGFGRYFTFEEYGNRVEVDMLEHVHVELGVGFGTPAVKLPDLGAIAEQVDAILKRFVTVF